MRKRLLVRHFLYQFVENDFTPDSDRHQVLALAAAGVITVPLFVTVLMGWRYLMRPLQAPGWTEITMLDDQMLFCGTSMLVSAVIATLQWDALSLSRRDAMILGVLPIPRLEVIRAKVLSLVIFASTFVAALNVLPAILHPPLMVANLALNPVMLVPLIGARALSTCLAGAFGFTFIVALRELLYAVLRRRMFEQYSDGVRSLLLFVLLVFVALLPTRLAAGNGWILEPGGPLVQRPVSWFAASDATIVGSVLERLHQPDMPAWRAKEEEQLRARYRHGVPRLHVLAGTGVVAVGSLLALAAGLYWWNARRLHLLPEEHSGAPIARLSRAMAGMSRLLGGSSAKRAGAAFLFRTAFDNPQHRLYLIISAAVSIALLNATAPTPVAGDPAMIRTYQVAAQALMLAALVAGFRAILRTSADERAGWTFAVGDTGNLPAYRAGVRLGVLTVSIAVIVVLIPMYARAWGIPLAIRHAVNGAALACVLVERACGGVDRPLIRTIPPNDALNTVGVVFLSVLVMLAFVLAHIERAALATFSQTALFAGALLVVAVYSRIRNARNHNLSSAALFDDVGIRE
jgi:hypothetical protein